MICKHKQFMIH